MWSPIKQWLASDLQVDIFQGLTLHVMPTHIQTLYINDSLMLCDCPGLVFPTFVTTKAELVCSGILPIDQMRDHVPPTALVS